ncbi:MAG: YiiD C-terminal domain-containing protein [Candidatus Berkiellales bacterium]
MKNLDNIAPILNQYLHEHIPITKAMGCIVKFASPDKVIIAAPFSNNINHKQSVFGGSLHAIATLACWGLLYSNFMELLGSIDIVITRSEINYHKPVTKDFEAICFKADPENWEKLKNISLHKKGKGRICLNAVIRENEKVAVAYQGEFAVIKRR